MGRHRRSAAGPASGPVTGTAPYLNPEAYAEAQARSEAYLYGTGGTGGTDTPAGPPVAAPRRSGSRRRKKTASVPVRTGLLGASAAVALGAVAVATGAVPGLDGLRIGGGPGGGDNVQAADSPSGTPSAQGGTSGAVDGGADESADDGSASPSASASASKKPSASPSSSAPSKTPGKQEKKKPAATPSEKTEPTPSRTATEEPAQTKEPAGGSVAVSEAAAAEAQVLTLVNEERAKVGCTPVAANSALTSLAEDFSAAMAAQDFFDHTDPSGATPWDRAEAAGITNLGGENIARGQADAAAVMDAWMNSEGHRANILNCDFKTLGVGVHFGSGGPWWTQDFGY
ncbi:CAP domain-containing protein [Streptomyces sp. JW3]|uniref:CAP domain-containing protein n=1 Tax=Streptomyces sp. JW3 TaxID=3456955 RepID=UPI003FA47D0F